MKVKYLAILLLLTSIFTFSSCQKEEEPVNVIENGVRSVHTFIVSPDILDLMDITLTWLDFDGIIKTDTLKSCKWEKEIETGTIPNSTGVVIRAKRNDVERSSVGRSTIEFEPNAARTFTRGAGEYFFDGKCRGVASFDTPKAMGERIGKVIKADRRGILRIQIQKGRLQAKNEKVRQILFWIT